MHASVDTAPLNVETPDKIAQSDKCDEICAEINYLQWKLRETMTESQRQAKLLVENYKVRHKEEIAEREGGLSKTGD